MLVFLGIAFAVLGIDPFSPVSMLRAFRAEWSLKQLLVAAGAIAFGFFIFWASQFVTGFARTIAAATGADPDLLLALLFATVALVVCSLVRWVTGRGVRLMDAAQRDGASGIDLAGARRSHAFWGEATLALTLVIIALVPAAFLLNWAWNVLASVLLPLLVLSIRSTSEEREGADGVFEPDGR